MRPTSCLRNSMANLFMPRYSRGRRPAALLALLLATLFAGGFAAFAAPLKIALISSGSFTDGGWNQAGKQAMLKLKKDLHAHISTVDHVSPVRAVDVMRDYVSQGYNLVIGHGYEFLVPARETAGMSKHTHFAVCGADVAAPGIATLDFELSGASYQLGVLAALKSKTGKLGFIGGEAIPSVTACYRGFVAGARSINPHVKVAQAYTSWDQPALSKSQAEAFIQQGIDVIYQNVDAASPGVFEAVAAANRAGHQVWVFGCNSDQNHNPAASRYTLASAVIRLDRAFEALAKSIQHHTFAAGVHREGLANNVCVVMVHRKLIGTVITPVMLKAVQQAGTQLRTGKITISPK